MITRTGELKHAQVGWIEYPYGVRNTITQWIRPDGFYSFALHDPFPVGSLTNYTVLYQNVPGKFTFQAGGTTYPEQPDAWFEPNRGETSGETKTLASQMPGGYSQLNYSWMAYTQIWYSNAWRHFSGQPQIVPPSAGVYFGYYVLDPSESIGIYDKYCPF